MKNRQLYQIHANICRSLTHATRLEIIDRLRDGEKSVAQLAKELSIQQGTLSRHLGVMRSTGVVLPRREGQNVYYRLGSPKIIAAYDLMHQFSTEFFSTKVRLISAEG